MKLKTLFSLLFIYLLCLGIIVYSDKTADSQNYILVKKSDSQRVEFNQVEISNVHTLNNLQGFQRVKFKTLSSRQGLNLSYSEFNQNIVKYYPLFIQSMNISYVTKKHIVNTCLNFLK